MFRTQAVNVQSPCKPKPQSWSRVFLIHKAFFWNEWTSPPDTVGAAGKRCQMLRRMCVYWACACACVCAYVLHSWLRPRPWPMRSSNYVCCLTSHSLTDWLHNPNHGSQRKRLVRLNTHTNAHASSRTPVYVMYLRREVETDDRFE